MHNYNVNNYNVNCACFLPLYRKKSEIYLAVYSLIRTFANDLVNH